MKAFACDLAISAVPSDAGLVAELIAGVAPRLRTTPEWRPDPAFIATDAAGALATGHSRVALVLHQHLWCHDDEMKRDATLLRERLRKRPGSICVITLDDAPLPSWLARAPRHDVAAAGRTGALAFVLDAIAAAGGSVRPEPAASAASAPRPQWPEPPTPFLSQPRAHSALRHELDTIIGALKPMIERYRTAEPERTFDLQLLPHRVVAQVDDVAITFSWLSGRVPTIAEGRLLVIAWRNVASGMRGTEAFKSATPIHERIYVADGTSSEAWRWRADDLTLRPYTSAHLAAEWMARAGVARAE
jgi:hypothetical protein